MQEILLSDDEWRTLVKLIKQLDKYFDELNKNLTPFVKSFLLRNSQDPEKNELVALEIISTSCLIVYQDVSVFLELYSAYLKSSRSENFRAKKSISREIFEPITYEPLKARNASEAITALEDILDEFGECVLSNKLLGQLSDRQLMNMVKFVMMAEKAELELKLAQKDAAKYEGARRELEIYSAQEEQNLQDFMNRNQNMEFPFLSQFMEEEEFDNEQIMDIYDQLTEMIRDNDGQSFENLLNNTPAIWNAEIYEQIFGDGSLLNLMFLENTIGILTTFLRILRVKMFEDDDFAVAETHAYLAYQMAKIVGNVDFTETFDQEVSEYHTERINLNDRAKYVRRWREWLYDPDPDLIRHKGSLYSVFGIISEITDDRIKLFLYDLVAEIITFDDILQTIRRGNFRDEIFLILALQENGHFFNEEDRDTLTGLNIPRVEIDNLNQIIRVAPRMEGGGNLDSDSEN